MEVFLVEEAFYQEVGIKDLGWEMGLPDYWCGSREGNPPGDPIRLPGLGPLVLHTFFCTVCDALESGKKVSRRRVRSGWNAR